MTAAVGMMAEAARHYAAGRSADAQRCCEAVMQTEPGHADARHLLGVLLLDRGESAAAVAALEQAARLLPGDAQVLYHLGNALLAADRPADAEARFQATLARNPDHIDARNNLGNALIATKQYAAAAECYATVLAVRPGFPPAAYNLGNALMGLGRPQAAAEQYRAALATEALHPDDARFAKVWCHLGVSLIAIARHEEAIGCFDEALRRAPNDALAESNRAFALLSLGRFAEGWPGYERRWDLPGFEPPETDYAPTPQPRDPAAMCGCRVLLRYEQGRGDTLHFVRYAPLLAAHGARVHLLVQNGLGALLSTLDGVASVHEVGERVPECDAIWPLASLPPAFATELATIPAQIPYLHASPSKAAAWGERLGSRNGWRIGLAWSGAADHGHDHLRSIPATMLTRLVQLPGCTFHVMQTEVRDADLDWMATQPALADHRDALFDFAETAALAHLMDVVISVDTAPAHLAGSLGKPVWIMLAFSAEWRWMTGRSDSPWYPTARLFRQPSLGDWASVLDAVQAALRELGPYRPTA